MRSSEVQLYLSIPNVKKFGCGRVIGFDGYQFKFDSDFDLARVSLTSYYRFKFNVVLSFCHSTVCRFVTVSFHRFKLNVILSF